MALTFAQVFLGAITVGLGLARGLEADLGFVGEDLTGESNYCASRLAAGHAHASNAIADNNVLAMAAMSPRLAVEADNIAMDSNAAVACPQAAIDPVMAAVCAAYTANKPRALAALTWIRAQQMLLWGSLEQLSGAMDKVAGAHGQEDVLANISALDPASRVGFQDPTQSHETWTNRNSMVSCALASKDALLSPMNGHAFPMLMPNLLAGLPSALIAGLPAALCPSMGSGGSGGSGAPQPITFPQLPQVSQKAASRCGESQSHLRDQLRFASSKSGSTKGQAQDGQTQDPNLPNEYAQYPTLSSDVAPFVKCVAMEPGATPPPPSSGEPDSFVIRRGNKLYTCSFDRQSCFGKALQDESAAFLKSIGLPSIPTFSMIGGSTRAPGALSPNTSNDFRASCSVQRPVNPGMANIAESMRSFMSFGQVDTPSTLWQDVSRNSTGMWYFPSGAPSPFAATPPYQRASVPAWKPALTSGRP
jgi:hypothetical protein